MNQDHEDFEENEQEEEEWNEKSCQQYPPTIIEDQPE